MSDAPAFCPYVGLRPFQEEDRPYFFGREGEVRAIVNNLYGASLTIFYGASGVGKSSVLMAGAVPLLRKEPRTAVVVFRSWQVPQASTQLKREIIEAATATAGHSLALDEGLPLDELLRGAGEAIDGTILLLLDQFEEYFLYFPDPGPDGGFDTELARSINRRDVDAGFLISMREDSLSRLDRFRKYVPTLFGNTQRLSHLSLDAAKLAIENPLDVYKREHPDAAGNPIDIEPALVQTLLDQVSSCEVSIAETGGAGQTEAAELAGGVRREEERVEAPYLQLVLERLWAKEVEAGSRVLTLATLESLGGANNIVRTHLDQVMERLNPTDQELCARVFDRLVTPSGAKVACRLRDLANWAKDLKDEVPRVTKVLQDNRLLAKISAPPGSTEEDDQYQIFHDVLAQGILNWRSRFLRRKETQEAEDAAAKKERKAAEDRRHADEESTRKRELQLQTERAEFQRQRAESESQRAESERQRAESERQLAKSERQRAEREQRLRKRFQFAIVAVGLMLAVSVLFGYVAWQKSKAEQAARLEVKDALRDSQIEAKKAKLAEAELKVQRVRWRYKKSSDWETAIKELEDVLRRESESAAAYEALGQVNYERGSAHDDVTDVDRAIGYFDKSLALGPKQVRTADPNQPSTLDPNQVSTLAGRAAARQYKGDVSGALADYDAAIALAPARASGLPPRESDLYYNRGAVHQSAGQNAAAIEDYSKAISLQRDFAAAYLARGQLSNEAGNRKQAIEDLSSAAKLADNDLTRTAAEVWLKKLGASLEAAPQTSAKVFLHIVDANDRSVAEAVNSALKKDGYRVQGIQTVFGGRTNGDVRYSDPDERSRAQEVAKIVETVLAQAGRTLTIRTFELDTRKFPEAAPDALEVWLPSLSGSEMRQLTSY